MKHPAKCGTILKNHRPKFHFSRHPNFTPLGEIQSKLALILDVPFLDITRWTLSTHRIRFWPNQIKRKKKKKTDATSHETQIYLQLASDYPPSEKTCTGGSETVEGVAAAAVCTQNLRKPYTCHLPDDSSVYTGELRAILLALMHVYHSQETSFLFLSDSLSSPQETSNMKYDHPIVGNSLELPSGLSSRDGKMWALEEIQLLSMATSITSVAPSHT